MPAYPVLNRNRQAPSLACDPFMNFRYWFGAACTVPFMPILYLQAKRVRATVPQLGDAMGAEGRCGDEHDSPFRIAFVGESTMAGIGAKTHDEAFAGSFAREVANRTQRRVHWEVVARSGFSTDRVTRTLVPRLPSAVDLIVAGVGGNDAFELRSPRRFRADVIRLIQTLRERHGETPVFFLSMPPIREFPAFTRLMRTTLGGLVELLGDELRDSVKDEPSVVFDHRRNTLARWTKDYLPDARPEDFFSDGVHPSLITYQTWAKASADWLLSQPIFTEKLQSSNV